MSSVFGVATAPAEEPPGQYFGVQPSLQDSEQLIKEGGHTLAPSTDPKAAEQLPREDLDRGEAIDLLSSVFGEQLQGAAGAFDELQVQKFLSDDVAVVRAEDQSGAAEEGASSEEGPSDQSQSALIESTLPLRAEESGGGYGEVDLGLEHSEGELQSANPLVEVGIPTELGEGIALPEQGITITAAGAPEDLAPSTVAQSTAVYPNMALDSDLVVAPTPIGVETLTQLRSVDAPSTERFDLQLPEGASLQATKEGGAEVVSGSKTLLFVPPPSALDANANDVPVSLEVSGQSITLHVEAAGDAAYPILVDPLFESFNWQQYDAKAPTHIFELEKGWVSAANTEAYTPRVNRVGAQTGYRLTVTSGGLGSVVAGSQANWNYYVPKYFSDYEQYTPHVRPTTYINNVTLQSLEFWFNDNPPNPSRRFSPYFQGGIWDSINGGWISVTTRTGVDGQLKDPAFSPPFKNENHNVNGKNFGIALISNEAGANTERQVSAAAATIELMDNDYPEWTPGSPSEWVNKLPTSPIPFSVKDLGLGMYRLTVEEQTTAGTTSTIETKQGCVGGVSSPCPRQWANTEEKVPQMAYDPSVMPTGEDWVKINAYDPIGHNSREKETAPAEARIKVDHVAPELALAGTMTEQATLGTKLPTYTLKLSATDGTTAQPQSGVAKTYVELDGKVADQATPGCSTKNCTVSREWSIEASKYSSGAHTIRVTATDAVGLTTVKTLGIELFPKIPTIALSGSMTEQASLGKSRPRYKLKVDAAAQFGTVGSLIKTAPAYVGSFGSSGIGSGQFKQPSDIARDQAGNIWVIDVGNNRVEEFNAKSEYVRSVGTYGSANGQLNRPKGVAIDPKGNIWVVDGGNRRLEEFNEKGEFVRTAGSAGGLDGQFSSFSGPEGIASDSKGNIWVCDSLNSRVEEFNEKGEYIAKVGTNGTGAGQLIFPAAVNVDRNGNLWIADWTGNRIAEFNEAREFVRQFGTEGTGNGQFKHPDDIFVDANGGVWVGDEGNGRLEEFNEKGEYVTQFGSTGTGAGQFSFANPMGIATDSKGRFWVADSGGNRVQEWQVPYVPAYRTSFGAAGLGNGQFSHPAEIALDAKGNLWVVDQNNERVEQFNASGEFLNKLGSSGTGNGQFLRPTSVAIDPKSNIWVTDAGSGRVEEFNEKGEYLAKFGAVGTGNGQFGNGGPESIAIDSKGNLWVADTYNGRVQKFNEKGEFLKVVSSKGTGAGQLGEPTGIDVGPGNNVWVADWQNNKIVEFNEAGEYLRQFGVSGAGSGQFSHPDVLVVDSTGGVWVGDQNNARVQEFNEKGEYLSQFGSVGAGKGQFSFGYPMGIATDSKGNFWVADTGNNRVERWSQSSWHSEVATEISIDGKPVDVASNDCSLETCPISREWELQSSPNPGAHTVQVKATDGFGQTTTKSLAIEIQPDTTKPTLASSGTLITAPKGWVEQQSYTLNATATDAGYGLNSLVAKIDGKTVASWTNACPDGACKATLAKSIDLSSYSGGAHPGEIIATDGAGNTTTKQWMINVDPDGHISTSESTATLEAAEATAGEEQPIVGLGEEVEPGLAASEGKIHATNTNVPLNMKTTGRGGFTVEPASEAALEGAETGDAVAVPPASISVTPIEASQEATNVEVANGAAAVVANTSSLAVDSVVRPLYDGAMTFQTIRDASAPTEYSWDVQLEPDQELKTVDSQHADVYYETGQHAFTITAVPAHDAIGTAVSTTLSVEKGHIITLHVLHRSAGITYPVIAGTGWEGGFATYVVEMPPPEPMPEEPLEPYVIIENSDAPEPVTAQEAGIEEFPASEQATLSSARPSGGPMRRHIVAVQCPEASAYDSGVFSCGNPWKNEHPGLSWNSGMRSTYMINKFVATWHKGGPEDNVGCVGGGWQGQNSTMQVFNVECKWKYKKSTSARNWIASRGDWHVFTIHDGVEENKGYYPIVSQAFENGDRRSLEREELYG